MNDQRQISPKLGLGKFGIIALIVGAIVCFVYQSRVPTQGNLDLNRSELFPCGCLFGLVAVGCWLATAVNQRYLRLAVRVSIVAGSAFLFGLLRENREWLQTAADLSGVAIMQCVMFYVFQVPGWRTAWSSDSDNNAKHSEQFAIADVAIATAMIAILLSMVIRHSPSIDPVRYWVVLAMAWAGGSIVTTCIARGMTSRSIPKMLAMVTIGLLIALIGTYAIAAADPQVYEGKISYDIARSFYGRIVAGYVITFTTLSILARWSPE